MCVAVPTKRCFVAAFVHVLKVSQVQERLYVPGEDQIRTGAEKQKKNKKRNPLEKRCEYAASEAEKFSHVPQVTSTFANASEFTKGEARWFSCNV